MRDYKEPIYISMSCCLLLPFVTLSYSDGNFFHHHTMRFSYFGFNASLSFFFFSSNKIFHFYWTCSIVCRLNQPVLLLLFFINIVFFSFVLKITNLYKTQRKDCMITNSFLINKEIVSLILFWYQDCSCYKKKPSITHCYFICHNVMDIAKLLIIIV